MMGGLDRIFRRRTAFQQRPLAAIIAGLWRNNEQGVWYDASDLQTMYQNAIGALPVYAPGQGQVDPPVGLLLDKRLGLAKGTELVVNGDFSQGATGWQVIPTAPGTVTFTPGMGAVLSAVGAGAVARIRQQWAVTPGWYFVRVVCSGDVSASTQIGCGSTAGGTEYGARQTTVGVNGLYVYCSGSTLYFSVYKGVNNGTLTIPEISVRKVEGNHAYQATTTSRPTLSARYNLLTNTENAAAWTKTAAETGTPPEVTSNVAVAPDGTMTADRCVMSRGSGTSNTSFSLIFQSASYSVATQSVRSIWMKSYTGSPQSVLMYDGSQTVGKVVTVTADWQQFVLTGGNPDLGTSLVFGTRGGDPGAYYASGGQQTLDILVWGMDIRPANDGVGLPPYQRVVDPNTYDTVGFPLYLKFDGVDDFLQTASIDFSGSDKLFASAAIRKLSDAAAGVVAELSSISNTNNGSFALLAPAGPGDTFAVYMRGATALTTSVPSGVTSPASRVFTGVMDTSAAAGRQSQSRINGTRYSYASQDSGGGNFGIYPLFIGRRGGTGLPFNGRIYCLIIRGGPTSDSLVLKVETYLNKNARIY